ncbi:transglutaminase domain-containing protein [Marilutibacter alkalisoli]|uniref:Transglutaminase domain-containing protein n=1 Tax=Marilutibacter alkalisoli TaxID=2591633 RepID=A0A514BS82_9GAMM|nr:transglutaminase domain-containing protein [Lysobacter alkalisoli]QDH70220.1 transglutaminase domain-containing protein [Lysobacter alkalisoli]
MLTWTMAAALALSTLDLPAPPPVPVLSDWEQVTAVPAELHAPLQEQVAAEPKPVRRLERLVEWMFASDGLAFEYDNEATRSVAETLHDRRGNCLSFTLAFVVLARRVGFDAHMQETDDVLVWPGSLDSNVVIHAGHVNAGVDVGGGTTPSISSPGSRSVATRRGRSATVARWRTSSTTVVSSCSNATRWLPRSVISMPRSSWSRVSCRA